PLEESFETQEAAIDDLAIMLNWKRLRPYVGSIDAFKVFRSFMVEEAFETSPELRRLEAAIDAQERLLLAARRSFFAPDVAAQAELVGNGRYGGGGSSIAVPGIEFPTPGNVDWTVGFSVSLPLFTSGARRSEVTRITEELAGLRVDLEATRQRVEQRARIELHAAGASNAGIELAFAGAEAARKTLDLVTDSYSRGVVDNIKLLDAQNQALLSDLDAANAVHDFLIDLMEVERAVGRFDFFVSPAQEAAFLERLDAYFQNEGFPVRKQEED
ncbi:MAG: TolC family protein, partial [bacterium]|nr:TolC family protein [bacterium]